MTANDYLKQFLEEENNFDFRSMYCGEWGITKEDRAVYEVAKETDTDERHVRQILEQGPRNARELPIAEALKNKLSK